ncbi:MAG: CDGSH iron-sulfur domain-containing protein [Ilumatobacteraceae bacterium]|jgi:CDGSH-type Zn-finger protein
MSNEPVRITPTENGPLLVEGAVTVCNPDGSVIREGEKVFLCRCGLSARKPFCDGTHSKESWTA